MLPCFENVDKHSWRIASHCLWTARLKPEQIAGMDLIVGILKEFEHMTDADIEAKIKAEWHRF